jgi:hypothetical protein
MALKPLLHCAFLGLAIVEITPHLRSDYVPGLQAAGSLASAFCTGLTVFAWLSGYRCAANCRGDFGSYQQINF